MSSSGAAGSFVSVRLPDLLDDLAVFREPADIVLREHGLAVDDHVEDAVPARNQLRLDAELLADLCRQTGGPWPVVSGRAVDDLHYFHDIAPFPCRPK